MISRSDEKIRKYWNFLPPDVRQPLLTVGFKLYEKSNSVPDTSLPRRKNHMLHIRVSIQEYKKIEVDARQRNMTLSEYIRFKCLL